MDNYTTLYLCDGYACKESEKECCYTQGFECHHTSDVNHSIMKLDPFHIHDNTEFVIDDKSKLQIQHFVKGKEFENKFFEERRELIFTLRKLLKTE